MRLRALTPMIALVAALGCAASPTAQVEANKELVQRFIETTNAADWDALATIMAPDMVRHSAATPGPPVTSRDAFVELQKSFLASFPDQHVILEQLIAEGDYVAVRARYAGTMTGPMGDFPATGKKVDTPFLGVIRIEGGVIKELWVEWDNIAMLTQLGLFPPPSPGEA